MSMNNTNEARYATRIAPTHNPDHDPDAASALGYPTERTNEPMSDIADGAWSLTCHDCDQDDDDDRRQRDYLPRPVPSASGAAGQSRGDTPTRDEGSLDSPIKERDLDASDHYEPEYTTRIAVGRRVSTPRAFYGPETYPKPDEGPEGVGPSPRPSGVPSESTESLMGGEEDAADLSLCPNATPTDATPYVPGTPYLWQYGYDECEEGSEPYSIIGRTSRSASQGEGRTHYRF